MYSGNVETWAVGCSRVGDDDEDDDGDDDEGCLGKRDLVVGWCLLFVAWFGSECPMVDRFR